MAHNRLDRSQADVLHSAKERGEPVTQVVPHEATAALQPQAPRERSFLSLRSEDPIALVSVDCLPTPMLQSFSQRRVHGNLGQADLRLARRDRTFDQQRSMLIRYVLQSRSCHCKAKPPQRSPVAATSSAAVHSSNVSSELSSVRIMIICPRDTITASYVASDFERASRTGFVGRPSVSTATGRGWRIGTARS